MNSIIKSFDSIADEKSRVLIIGMTPSVTSENKCMYYAHKENVFWTAIGKVIEAAENRECVVPQMNSVCDQREFLLKHKIALWDIVGECETDGTSLNKNIIKIIKNNDVYSLAEKYPNIKYIFFNGKDAFDEYKRFLKIKFPEERKPLKLSKAYAVLISTSPSARQSGYSKQDVIDMWVKFVSPVLSD